MTDRVAGFTVTLDDDIREDDAEIIAGAIRVLRRVVSVEPVAADAALHIAERRARAAITGKVLHALHER